ASRRTFLALALTMVWPIETWPSPPIATVPALRTVRIVVPCQASECWGCIDMNSTTVAMIYALKGPNANLDLRRHDCGPSFQSRGDAAPDGSRRRQWRGSPTPVTRRPNLVLETPQCAGQR